MAKQKRYEFSLHLKTRNQKMLSRTTPTPKKITAPDALPARYAATGAINQENVMTCFILKCHHFYPAHPNHSGHSFGRTIFLP
jgi:hypothetical protein